MGSTSGTAPGTGSSSDKQPEVQFSLDNVVDETDKMLKDKQTNDSDVQELLSSLDEMLKMSMDSVIGFELFAVGQPLPQVAENSYINGFLNSNSGTPPPLQYQSTQGRYPF